MSKKREPIRCFEGDAQPHEPFWTIRNEVEGEEPEIELYGYISEYSWFDDDVTPGMFKKDLYDAGKGGPVTVRINSYGGDVIAASMINILLRDYPGKVTVQIDGVAASAATMVAMAGDVVRIQDVGYFMIHDPAYAICWAYLNIEDMTRLADGLKAIKEGIVNAYETKTGLSRPRISNLMTEETWMDANKALDLGFVDEIIKDEKITIEVPENAAVVNAVQNFANVPPAVMQAFKTFNVQEQEEAASSEPLLTEDMEREAESLRERVNLILDRR